MFNHRSRSLLHRDDEENAAVAQHPESSVELVEFNPTTSSPLASTSRDHSGSTSKARTRDWKERWKGRHRKQTLPQPKGGNTRPEPIWEEGKQRASTSSYGEEEEKPEYHTPKGHGGGAGENADMKFSHSIQFNAVQEWSSHYIAYSNLKKL